MSTLEWRREQPRVEPPSSPWFWVDLFLVGMMVIATLMQVYIFVMEGWPPALVMCLWSGFIIARFYPFKR